MGSPTLSLGCKLAKHRGNRGHGFGRGRSDGLRRNEALPHGPLTPPLATLLMLSAGSMLLHQRVTNCRFTVLKRARR
jgi:hypothetical protein